MQPLKHLSVAPMMDWTDRHCRFFHRQLSQHVILYTEMVTADAVRFGDQEKLLGYHDVEHPIVLQLGGANPEALAQAAQIGAQWGYDGINLNVGCPSDRVQSGRFGACLMREPNVVADCVSAMVKACSIPVSVKCRIGVDDQDTEIALDDLANAVGAAGSSELIVHARKAWLQGLSPKENRDIPPLDYDRVHRLKSRLPETLICLNGGLKTLEAAQEHLDRLDGAMFGRAAYHNPSILLGFDKVITGTGSHVDLDQVIKTMHRYIEGVVAQGFRPHAVTRHMLGLFQGVPGARKWRQILTVGGVKPNATADIIFEAYDAVRPALDIA